MNIIKSTFTRAILSIVCALALLSFFALPQYVLANSSSQTGNQQRINRFQVASETPDVTETEVETETPDASETEVETETPEASETEGENETPEATHEGRGHGGGKDCVPGANGTPETTRQGRGHGGDRTRTPEANETEVETEIPDVTETEVETEIPDVTETEVETEIPDVTETPEVSETPEPTVDNSGPGNGDPTEITEPTQTPEIRVRSSQGGQTACEAIIARAQNKITELQTLVNALPARIAAARIRLEELKASGVDVTAREARLDAIEQALPTLQTRITALRASLSGFQCAAGDPQSNPAFKALIQQVKDLFDFVRPLLGGGVGGRGRN